MTTLLEFQRTLAQAVMQPLTAQTTCGAATAMASRWSSPTHASPHSSVLKSTTALTGRVCSVPSAKTSPAYARWLEHQVLTLCGVRILPTVPPDRSPCATSDSILSLGQTHPAYTEPHTAAVLDMAKLEWAEIESFDAAEYERLASEDIAALDPDASLQLQPHLRLAGGHARRRFADLRNSRGGPAPRRLRRASRAARALNAPNPRIPSISPSIAMSLWCITSGWMRKSSGCSALSAKEPLDRDAVELAYAESTLTPEACAQHIQNSFASFAALGWFSKSRPAANQEAR